MTTSIYQIQYSDDIVGTFDPAFIKYDCRDKPEFEKREIAHMLRFYNDGLWRQQGTEYFGLVSPKFSDKTKISGNSFINWIDANPGYDVYFINPFPQLSYWRFNVWTQGEFWHPGLVDISNALFSAAGLSSIRVEKLPRNTASTLLYCNYWVGNEKFWRLYMTFVRKLVIAANALKVDDKEKLHSLAPHYAPATYFPFVFERLFSTFLILQGEITYLNYKYEHAEILDRCNNEMERFIIREWAGMIDTWDVSGRDDAEYRKLFANLQGMLRIYQNVAPCEGGLNQSTKKLLIAKFKRMLGLVHPR